MGTSDWGYNPAWNYSNSTTALNYNITTDFTQQFYSQDARQSVVKAPKPPKKKTALTWLDGKINEMCALGR